MDHPAINVIQPDVDYPEMRRLPVQRAKDPL